MPAMKSGILSKSRSGIWSSTSAASWRFAPTETMSLPPRRTHSARALRRGAGRVVHAGYLMNVSTAGGQDDDVGRVVAEPAVGHLRHVVDVGEADGALLVGQVVVGDLRGQGRPAARFMPGRRAPTER